MMEETLRIGFDVGGTFTDVKTDPVSYTHLTLPTN